MKKFIEVHNDIINVESIKRVEFVSDDIYLDLFPLDDKGEPCIDMVDFTFAKIHLLSGEVLDVQIDLYAPTEEEIEEDWLKINRAYISMGWNALRSSLGEAVKVTGHEYLYG